MPPKKAASKPRAPKGGAHKLAKALPAGEIMRDFIKGEWKLGKPIGSGGFGLIYLADRNGSGPVSDNAPYVMKLEPHANGPLFCELHFYQRVAKPDFIEQWVRDQKLRFLGVPRYIASGAHDRDDTRYRFMVMERCDRDLQKILDDNGSRFSERATYALGIRMMNALEYIHDKEYVHADIKAANILTGYGKGKTDEVYLVDYGLAYRYTTGGTHKPYKEDPKRLHDGTVEFTSRDAHKGVAPSRRGDLEILGYCMMQWLCGRLPWEDKLNNKDYVRDQKVKYMNNVNSFINKCASGHTELAKFLQYTSDLQYDQRPDYNKCRDWFRAALKRHGGKETDKLVLGAKARDKSPTKAAKARAKSPTKPAKVSKKRKSDTDHPHQPASKYLSADSDSGSDFQPESPISLQRRPITSPRTATPSNKRKKAENSTPRAGKGSAGTPRRIKSTRLAANGDLIPAAAVPPPGLRATNEHGDSEPPKSRTKTSAAKKKVMKSSTATQTSPGLKGLARSRKKTTAK